MLKELQEKMDMDIEKHLDFEQNLVTDKVMNISG